MISAVVAAAAVQAPSREALIARWLRANPSHSVARLESPALPNAPAVDLRALAARELSVRGRYHLGPTTTQAVPMPWWRRALNWLTEWWRRLWRSVAARVHVSERAANGIADALLAIVGLALLIVLWRLLRELYWRRFPRRLQPEPVDAFPDPRSLYRQACDRASHGEYGDAALLLFAATVAVLSGRDGAAAERSATVGDLRRRLRRDRATLLPAFDSVAAPFVQRAYAQRTVEPSQWNDARDAFQTLLRHLAPLS